MAAGAVLFGTPVEDIQSNLAVSGNEITGTLHDLTEGSLVETWGAGNFMALQLSGIDPRATSVMVGMDPSEGSGLVEIIDDPDLNGVFKVTDKDNQVFVVRSTDGTQTKEDRYDLTGLTVEG